MRRAVSLLLLVVVLTACGDDGGDDDEDASSSTTASTGTTTTIPPAEDPLSGFVPTPLAWQPCDSDLECATLVVPLDWADPGGRTIDLAVTRVPASGGDPIGGIALNPGGPGASGNEFIAGGGALDADLAERYDTISWDPRGLGGSTLLGCDGDEVDDFVRLDTEPDTSDEQAELDDGAQAVADRCDEVAGDLLPFMGTGAVARDLEAIRRAYGAPMGYLGFSYGTSIGLQHLALFPGTMLGVVLDGVVDPSDTQTDMLRGQAASFESTIDEILTSCPAGSEGCPDGGGAAAYDELEAELEDAPLDAGGDELRVGDLTTAAIYATYSESFHQSLLDGLGAAQSGDGSVLLALAEAYHDGGSFDVYQAVSCLDSVNPVGGPAWAAFAGEMEAAAPRVGGAVANEMLPCAFWPAAPVPLTGPVVAVGAGPVVVLGTLGDPVTPVEQARTVAETLEDGRFVEVDGASHGAYYASDCARDVVAAYFLDGVAPEDGTRC